MGGAGNAYETQAGAGESQPQAGQSQSNIVIPLEQESVSVGTQPVNEGAVRVHKIIRTETVNQPVQIRREIVTVDREPANAQASAQASQGAPGSQNLGAINTPFQEGEVTINLMRDQPVVQTQVVPAGSVVIHKQTVTQPVNVQHQIRKEDVEVAKIGNSPDVTISGDLNNPNAGTADNSAAPPSAQGSAPGFTGQSSGGAASTGAITQLNQLTSAQDPSTLAGKQVNLSGVAVQDLTSDHLLTVGSGNGQPICVRSEQPIRGITKGQTVNINGVVKSTPQSVSSLGLDQASAAQLQNQPFYVDAISVTPANQ
jgi:uncharacterized protein (TIGR02271 family)